MFGMNLNDYIDWLLHAVGIIGVILLFLELITIERPTNQVDEQKKWKENEEDECIFLDNPPE